MTSKNHLTQKAWFSFGWGHAHNIAGFTYDKDIIVEIESPNPRKSMFEIFGQKWSMQYDTKPDMSYFPRGIKKLKHTPSDD